MKRTHTPIPWGDPMTTPGPSETIHPTDKIAGRWVADMQPVRVLDGAGLGTGSTP